MFYTGKWIESATYQAVEQLMFICLLWLASVTTVTSKRTMGHHTLPWDRPYLTSVDMMSSGDSLPYTGMQLQELAYNVRIRDHNLEENLGCQILSSFLKIWRFKAAPPNKKTDGEMLFDNLSQGKDVIGAPSAKVKPNLVLTNLPSSVLYQPAQNDAKKHLGFYDGFCMTSLHLSSLSIGITANVFHSTYLRFSSGITHVGFPVF
ncbi:hypothetical protein CSKR_108399 [Clonorchis sinensis]|uniref:Uncharacterized protein n=1 Tax=Clonorchis sinensis TaxID=79923 RepID=A0A3R7JNK9_CLOSI|nr:hypothetical protein CSKR_108399 [Clonorchis sinensis]